MNKTANDLNLRSLAFKFEERTNTIACRVETLDDIATNLKHLQDDMAMAVQRGTQKISYDENYREVRILAELMHWTVQELIKNQKASEELTYSFLKQVRNDE